MTYLSWEIYDFELLGNVRNKPHKQRHKSTHRNKDAIKERAILRQWFHKGSSLKNKKERHSSQVIKQKKEQAKNNSNNKGVVRIIFLSILYGAAYLLLTYPIIHSEGIHLHGHGKDVYNTVDQARLKLFLQINKFLSVGSKT